MLSEAPPPLVVEPRGPHALARMLPRPPCERCGDSGFVSVLHGAEWRAGRCRCQMLPDRVRLWNAAQVPSRYAQCILDAWIEPPRALQLAVATLAERARTWSGQPGRGLLLHGAPGRGKTHIAVSLLRSLVFERGWSGRYIEVGHLFNSMKAAIAEHRPTDRSIAELVAARVIVLDDASKPDPTPFERSVIDELVTRIYASADSVLLVTTNLEPARLGEAVGERSASRLRELCDEWACGGPDFRRRRA